MPFSPVKFGAYFFTLEELLKASSLHQSFDGKMCYTSERAAANSKTDARFGYSLKEQREEETNNKSIAENIVSCFLARKQQERVMFISPS